MTVCPSGPTTTLDPAAAAAATAADIQIRGSDGTIYLTETALRALPTDHNLYLNEGDSAVTTIQVFDRGVPAGAGVNVAMFDANSQTLYGTQTTAADGTVQFTMNAIAGGAVEPYVLVAGPTPASDPGLDPQLTPYMYVRTLPADAAIGALDPTWANVYTNVLQNWNAMAPCMDNWLRLNDEAQVRAYAPILKQLTDPANFERYRFMPVTRDMTVGERTLLYNFGRGRGGAAQAADAQPGQAQPGDAEQLTPARYKAVTGATVYCTGRTTRAARSEMNRPETIEETAALVTRSTCFPNQGETNAS